MRILSRHFLANYLGLFSLTLIIALILMTVIEMLVNLDDVVENRESAGGALAYLLIRVPSLYMRDVIPAASAIAAFLCLALAARAREITALKTGGIPPLRIALPVLMAAMALSGVALVLNETLLLGATREFTRLQHPEESVVFRRGSFWYHRENTFYNVREIDPAAGTMQGIHVYTLSPEGRLLETLDAPGGVLDSGARWSLQNVTRRHFDPDVPDSPPRLERLPEVKLMLASPGELSLLERSVDLLSLPELIEAIQLHQREGRDPLRYRAILHTRLANPTAVFVLALLVVPIGIGVERRRSLAAAALAGVVLIAAYRAAWQLATLVAQGGFRAGPAAPWLVALAFTCLGAVLFARAPR